MLRKAALGRIPKGNLRRAQTKHARWLKGWSRCSSDCAACNRARENNKAAAARRKEVNRPREGNKERREILMPPPVSRGSKASRASSPPPARGGVASRIQISRTRPEAA